ncbi:hypothetical protein K8S19_12740 [bacterium]|nr:hypothetical protein [bacterium]
MKTLSLRSSLIVLLSALVWLGYYLLFPNYPLRTKETLVIVFLCTLLVLCIQWLWKTFRKLRQSS